MPLSFVRRAMKVKSTEEIEALLSPIAAEQGLEIVEVELKVSKNPSLTVYIDSESGVDLNACERFHRAIDAPLDELDPTFGAPYTLNVSSPGLDRPFKRERDFLKAVGDKVEAKLFAPMNGQKYFEGTLKSYDGTSVTLETDKGEVKLPLTRVAKINRYIDIE